MIGLVRGGAVRSWPLLACALAAGCSDPESSPTSSAGASSAAVSGNSSSGASASTGTGGDEGGGGAGGSGAAGGGGSGGVLLGARVDVVVTQVLPDVVQVGGVPIVVNDASGAVVAEVLSEAAAAVPVVVPAGGLVAIFPGGDLAHHMRAVVDPPDGSTIDLRVFGGSLGSGPFTTYAATLTGYPPATATISLYYCYGIADVAADSNGTTIGTFDDDNCLQAANNDVLAIAKDSGGVHLAWGVAKGIPTNPGGSVALSFAVDQLAFKAFTSTIAPIDPSTLSAGASVATQSFQLSELAMPPAPTETWTFTVPDVDLPFDTVESVRMQSGAIVRTAERHRSHLGPPATASFDPASLAPITQDALDNSDPLHPSLSWSLQAGPVGDAVEVYFFRQSGPPVTVFLPPTASSFRLPDIPSSLPDYQGASSWTPGPVKHLDQESANGWAELHLFVQPPVEDGFVVTTGGP